MLARILTLAVSVVILSSCAPDGGSFQSSDVAGQTGGTDGFGVPYTGGGDNRAAESNKRRLIKADPPPKTAHDHDSDGQPSQTDVKKPATEEVRLSPVLTGRLKEFQISRFAADTAQPSRFGDRRFEMKIFFRDASPITFTGELTGAAPHFQLKIGRASDPGYKLTGKLDDVPSKKSGGSKWEQTEGRMVLTDARGETAEIFYWAYRGKIKARTDRSHPLAQSSNLAKQIEDLNNKNSFAWVNNWTVTGGVGFFVVDFITVRQPTEVDDGLKPLPKPLVALKGESKDASEADVGLEPVAARDAEGVEASLAGNEHDGTGKIIAVNIPDKESAETHQVYFDVELDRQYGPAAPSGQDTKPPVKGEHEDTADDSADAGAGDDSVGTPDHVPLPEFADRGGKADDAKKSPLKDEVKPKPQPAADPSKSYFDLTSRQTLARKMIRDFDRNADLPGVKQWMTTYKTKRVTELKNFFNNANPFRRLINVIGETFGVGPTYAFVTIIESGYFKQNGYPIQSNGNVLGPGQFKPNTAREMKLVVGGGYDERRYFATSACGMARYFKKLAGIFDDSDSTLAILGYNQGDGGAAAAIYCMYSSGAGDRAACARKINRSFTGKDYARFLDMAKNFNYTYARMERMSAMPKGFRDYVNMKLAVYFISKDYRRHVSLPTRLKTSLPANVKGPRQISDPTCRQAVDSVL